MAHVLRKRETKKNKKKRRHQYTRSNTMTIKSGYLLNDRLFSGRDGVRADAAIRRRKIDYQSRTLLFVNTGLAHVASIAKRTGFVIVVRQMSHRPLVLIVTGEIITVIIGIATRTGTGDGINSGITLADGSLIDGRVACLSTGRHDRISTWRIITVHWLNCRNCSGRESFGRTRIMLDNLLLLLLLLLHVRSYKFQTVVGRYEQRWR